MSPTMGRSYPTHQPAAEAETAVSGLSITGVRLVSVRRIFRGCEISGHR